MKTGRGGQDVATSQEAPGPLANTRSWRRGGQASLEPSQGAMFWPTPEAGGEEDRPPWSLHREPRSGQHLDLGPPALNWERTHFCCLELLSLWSFYSSIRKLTHGESGKSHTNLTMTQMCRIWCCVNPNRAGGLPVGGGIGLRRRRAGVAEGGLPPASHLSSGWCCGLSGWWVGTPHPFPQLVRP